MQAEAWMKSKLQDLKDGCNVQHRPLHDWEEASQTLHRDLKDFENTLIQLNQVTNPLRSQDLNIKYVDICGSGLVKCIKMA